MTFTSGVTIDKYQHYSQHGYRKYSNYVLLTCCKRCYGRSVTYQADELPVKPTQHIRTLFRLCPKDAQAGHEHCSCFLVKG